MASPRGSYVFGLRVTPGRVILAVVAVLILLRIPVLGVLLVLGGAGLAGRRALRSWRRQQAELAEARRIRELRAYEVSAYRQMSPGDFERALAVLCRRDGCSGATVKGGPGDLGADVVATSPEGRKIVIQAKRYADGNPVSGPDLQKFAGTCWLIHSADVAAVVTTSSFTRQARELALRAGIVLVDGDALGGWVTQTGPPPWLARGMNRQTA